MIAVYKLIFEDGKYYVGRTSNLERRKNEHYRQLRNKRHPNNFVQSSYDKYGDYKFEYEECKSIEEAKEKEQYYLDVDYENTLNISKHSECGDLITYHPDRQEIVDNIKNGAIERYRNMTKEEKVEKHGQFGEKNGMYGKKHTDESKKKMSEFLKGRVGELNHFYGKKHTEETKKKISDIASKRIGELNPFYGKTHSEETKRKLREANLGKKPSNSKKVEIEGFIYESVTEASRQLNVVPATIIHRIKSKNIKYNGYKYVECNDYPEKE